MAKHTPAGASDLPGLEVAGVIGATGAGVGRWRAGDAVCALVAGGGYAEAVVAPESQCSPIPAGLSMIEAAAVPRRSSRSGRTSRRGGSPPASGCWCTAARAASAPPPSSWRSPARHVAATAGSDEKCAACLRLGATCAWNYRTVEWVSAAREATGGRGVDVVLDMVGGDYTPRNLEALAVEGRLVQIAFLKSARVELDLGGLMRRRLWITGSTLRPRTPAEKGAIARALEAEVWPWLAARRVAPIIDRVFPLADAAAAHARMESSAHIGKIVLDVRA